LNGRPKILVVGDSSKDISDVPAALREEYELIWESNPLRALILLKRNGYAGVYLFSDAAKRGLKLNSLFEKDRILDGMPDGVALLDEHNSVLWANDCLQRWLNRGNIIGENFYTAVGTTNGVTIEYCPFRAARCSGQGSAAIIKTDNNRHFHLHAAPIISAPGEPLHLIVTVRDVTTETLQQQKLAAIHKAGMELASHSAEEIFNMPVEDRVALLKSNILHFTKDLLHFDVVEIRLLQKDGELAPLLAVGLDPEAESRRLYAEPKNNGVTGFVASTGKSYLCEDTSADPLFLEGFKGSKSSLTVPLNLHDEVIGTFNVESPKTKAFTEDDLQFLEIFARDVARAVNTLELLIAQKATALQEGVEAIHSAVAIPIDEILKEAVHVMERYIGHDVEVVQRVQRILKKARDIRQVIQKVGREMTPAEAVPPGSQVEARPKLVGKRILVVDADDSVLTAAHALLERYGCTVETTNTGTDAEVMARNSMRDVAYDVVISDIHLPDMTGYGLMVKLKEMIDPVPLILMKGFGYDPEHAIAKARQAGLSMQALLHKPFRLDQLLSAVEFVLASNRKVTQET
jgi:CheY-like chemotaxis protein